MPRSVNIGLDDIAAQPVLNDMGRRAASFARGLSGDHLDDVSIDHAFSKAI
jgi:hypothetical protein